MKRIRRPGPDDFPWDVLLLLTSPLWMTPIALGLFYLLAFIILRLFS